MSSTDKQIKKIIGRVAKNINIEAILPSIAPGIIGNIPQVAAMGITPDIVRAALAPPAGGDVVEDSDTIEIPSGGAWRLIRDMPKLTGQDLMRAIEYVINAPEMQGHVEEFCGILYYAIGQSAVINQSGDPK